MAAMTGGTGAGRQLASARLGLGLGLGLLCICVAPAQTTENVVIINIDGLRYAEGPGSGSANFPFIWDSLRPLGTLYDNLYNTGITVTNSAHSAIVSGVRQLMFNNLNCASQIRPRDPTIGECFRRYTGASMQDVAFINGKPLMWGYPVSTATGYGPAWAPTISYTTDEDDWVTLESTYAIINRNHPKLCYILFGEVDRSGHTGDTARYINSIKKADLLTWLIWRKLQSDTVYRGRTTLIITNDHGRHDDAHGGWKNHGCYCRGCRRVMFLAIGPEIKVDTVVTTFRDQIDIAPTVGHLMGFPMPFAQGTVMTEMLKPGAGQRHLPRPSNWSNPFDAGEVNLSHSAAFSRSADICRSAKGLHVVYADRTRGAYETYYTRSTNSGVSWSDPVIVIPNASPISHCEPTIAAVGDTLLVGVAGLVYAPAETTFVWALALRRSTDAGATWDSTRILDVLGALSCKPAIAAQGSTAAVVANHYTYMTSYKSRNAGASFGLASTVTPDAWHHPQWPSAAILDTNCYVVWQDCVAGSQRQYHEIWFDREPWREDYGLTRNDTLSLSYQPWLTRDVAGNLHVVYCHLPDAPSGNRWQVNYLRSADRGERWTLPVRLSNTRTAYAPALRSTAAGKLVCVWAGFDSPVWSLTGCVSSDGGRSWCSPESFTSRQAFSIEPRLAVRGDTAFVVWEDYRDGNWEIYFTRRIFSGSGIADQSSPPRAIHNTLEVRPNPCRGPTVLRMAYSVEGSTLLTIHDASGRLVRSFPAPSARHAASNVVWNGADDRGAALPAGVYHCTLITPTGRTTRPVVLLK